jgi:histidinol phosphatase-like PHP family hydrolase
LNVALLKIAREHDARISLGTDAHHPWQLGFIELGLAAALRAKVPAQQIVNFMTMADLKGWIRGVRDRSATATQST